MPNPEVVDVLELDNMPNPEVVDVLELGASRIFINLGDLDPDVVSRVCEALPPADYVDPSHVVNAVRIMSPSPPSPSGFANAVVLELDLNDLDPAVVSRVCEALPPADYVDPSHVVNAVRIMPKQSLLDTVLDGWMVTPPSTPDPPTV